MRKKISIISLPIIILSMTLSACQNQKLESTSQRNNKLEQFASPSVSQNGKSNPTKEQIYTSLTSTMEQAISYPDIPSLVPASSAIIYGVVEDYDYKPLGSLIYTFSKVKVLESFMGTYQPGDTLTVLKLGGYVTLKEYFDSFTDPEKRQYEIEFLECENMSDEELNSQYIEEISKGAIPAEIGNTSILFLTPPMPPENKPDVFIPVGSYQGEYKEVEPGIFYKPGLDSLEELKNSLSGTEKENEDIIQSRLKTKEEIVAEIENAL